MARGILWRRDLPQRLRRSCLPASGRRKEGGLASEASQDKLVIIERNDVMTEQQLDLPFAEEPEEAPLELSALARHYQRQGRGLDDMRLSIANLAQKQVFIYSLQIRWPTTQKPGHTLMVKAILEDGPKITFHNDFGWLTTLLGFGARMRAGQVDWYEDNFPPEDWVERLAHFHKNQYYSD